MCSAGSLDVGAVRGDSSPLLHDLHQVHVARVLQNHAYSNRLTLFGGKHIYISILLEFVGASEISVYKKRMLFCLTVFAYILSQLFGWLTL